MKITKAMGRAALGHLNQVEDYDAEWNDEISGRAWDALDMMAGRTLLGIEFNEDEEHYYTALAMCAAIAGVKPEDVE